MVAAVAALSYASTPQAKAAGGAGWQVAGAPYRIGLTVNDPKLEGTLSEFPLKVVLTPQNFDYAKAAADGVAADASSANLAFVPADDAGNTQLAYQVDTWKPGGTSVVWVRVPSLTAGEQLELYYGAGGTYEGPTPSAVWTGGYTSVNEFNPEFGALTAPTLADPLPAAPQAPSAAGAGLPGLPNGTVFPDLVGGTATQATLANDGAEGGADYSNAVIGDAGATAAGEGVQLSGGTSAKKGTYLTLPAAVGKNEGVQTLSTTVYVPQSALTAAAAGSGAAGLLGQHGNNETTVTPPGTAPGSNGSGAIFMALANECIYVPVYYGPGITYKTVSDCGASGNATGGAVEPGTPPVTAGWHTVDVVLNGTAETLYIDGVELSTNTLPEPVDPNPTSPFIMGQYSSGATSGQGSTAFGFDQLTMSKVARSGEWVQAEYASQTDSLVNFGTRQDVTTPTGVTVGGTGSEATLSWNAVDGATEYLVYEGAAAGGEGATPVATVTSPTAQVTGLSSAAHHYFTVAAVTPSGTSAPSDEVEYTWAQAPSGLSPVPFHDGSTVQLRWSAPADANASTTYSVHLGTSAGGEEAAAAECISLSATSCLAIGLNTDTTYFFTVTAKTAGAESLPSAETSIRTAASNTSGRAWQLGGSEYRLPMEVGDATLVERLEDFPVKVVLTPKNFDYAGAATDGVAADASPDDLAFVLSADANAEPMQLPYQVDSWKPGGTSIVWVLLPQFEGNVALNNIDLYYGGSADYAGPNVKGTWSNGYQVVNQMVPSFEGVTAPTLPDPLPAAPQGPSPVGEGDAGLPTGTKFPDLLGGPEDASTLETNGATEGSVFSNEVLGEAGGENAGEALQLSGSTGGAIAGGGAAGSGGTYLSMPASTGANEGVETLSTTVYFPQTTINQAADGGAAAAILGQHYQSLTVTPPGIEQGSGGTGAIFMALATRCVYVPVYYGEGVTYSTVGTCGANSTGGSPGAGQAPITPGWHTLDVVLKGTSETLYIDGVLRSTNTMPQPVDADPSSPFILGEYSDVKQGYASAYGYDQLSVADVARSSSWVQAEYQSQENQVIEYGSSASVSTPTGVSASGSGNSVTVSWGAVSGATGYEVFEGAAPGEEDTTPITCSSETVTSCTVSNLPSGVDYFTVAALTSGGTSLSSAEVSYTYLTAPTTVEAETISDTSAMVSWSAVGGATSYSVYEGSAAGGESAIAINCKALTPTSCLVTGLTDGAAAYFKVSADRGGFVSAASTAEGSATPGTQGAWAIPDAQERVAVTLQASAIASQLKDFPVQVQLPESFDYTNASPEDLLFTRGADPTPLAYEVEDWNPAGVSTIWVKIPTLAPADPPLYMYYHGLPATSTTAGEVWGPSFLGVYHFGDAAGSTAVTDSTTNGADGTVTYGTASTGAVQFEGEGQDGSPSMTELKEDEATVSFGALGEGVSEFTYSASVGIDSPDAGFGELVLAGRNAPTGTEPGEQFSLLTESNEWVPNIEAGTDPTVDSTSTYQGDKPTATQTGCTAPVNYPAAGWTFYDLTMAYDGSSMRFFVDGAEICDIPFSGPLEPGALPFAIGMATPGGSKPEGSQWGDWNWDEMRFSDVARSADWVEAEHLAQAGELASTGSPQADFKTSGASIDGTGTVGGTLTADTGGFSPPATVYGYQWFEDGAKIDGATSPTLQLTASMAGHQITVEITGTDDGITLSPTSAPVTVALGQFSAGTPTISGPAKVGATLNANAGKWTPAGAVAYRWLRDGTAIEGATAAAYSPVAADEGKAITVEVTESATGYADDSATSAPVTVAVAEAPSHPVGHLGTPTMSGTARVGETVTASSGEWSPAATPAYQWFLDGDPIAGATGSTYAIAPGDAGHQLSVEVTEEPAGVGPETALSAAAEVQAATFAPGTATIGGTAAVGSTLSASPGDWSPTPAQVTYQWLRDGAPIAGATSATYAVTAGDAGHAIGVTVRVASPGFEAASATSATVLIPTPAPALPVGGTTTKNGAGGKRKPAPANLSIVKKPRIVGAGKVGGKLTASSGSWNVKPASVSYQWLRGGKAIKGATHPTYKVTKADAGATLSVKVTASAPGSGKVTVTSAKVRLAS
ncbi:MAG TPA: DUF2341 domain-containing protein [Solirubrobacterales bacterium]